MCPIDIWPQNRMEDQNYLFYSIESPTNTLHYFDRKIMTDTYFNTSATFRVDSTVFMPSNDALTRITPNTPKEDIWDENEVIHTVKYRYFFVAVYENTEYFSISITISR